METTTKTETMPRFRVTKELYEQFLAIVRSNPLSDEVPDHLRAAVKMYVAANANDVGKTNGKAIHA